MTAAAAEAHLLEARAEAWPLAKPFVIARGAKTEAHVIVAAVAAGAHVGRGEAVPYARYGESVEAAVGALRSLSGPLSRGRLPNLLPAGAARNALDCALWDLEAKQTGKRVLRACRPAGAASGDDLLHAEPWRAGTDGRRCEWPPRI